MPSRQRTTEPSLLRRLEIANIRNRELTEETSSDANSNAPFPTHPPLSATSRPRTAARAYQAAFHDLPRYAHLAV